MQVFNAGQHKLLLLELDTEFISNIAKQAGFEFKLEEGAAKLDARTHRPRQAGSAAAVRCGRSRQPWLVLAMPILRRRKHRRRPPDAHLASPTKRIGAGGRCPTVIRLQIAKEIPANFRLPGKQPVNEQMLYAVLV